MHINILKGHIIYPGASLVPTYLSIWVFLSHNWKISFDGGINNVILVSFDK